MKLVIEILAGVAMCGTAYYLARPDTSTTVMRPAQHDAAREAVPYFVEPTPFARAADAHRIRPADALPTSKEQAAIATLRSAVINATTADMRRRDDDVMRCLPDVELAGVQKLRFAVNVESTPREAIAGAWRFVEIADGEPLPPAFAACALRALGGGYKVLPPTGLEFPLHRGEIVVVYTIPALPAQE